MEAACTSKKARAIKMWLFKKAFLLHDEWKSSSQSYNHYIGLTIVQQLINKNSTISESFNEFNNVADFIVIRGIRIN